MSPKSSIKSTALSVVIAASLVAGVSAPACAAEVADGSYMDLAVATGYVPTLGAALRAAGLVEDMRGPGPFTLFVPAEWAFARMPPGVFDELMRPANRAELRRVLLNHIVAGRIMAADIGRRTEITSLSGTTLVITRDRGQVMVNGARISTFDMTARNGVIHVVDAVVMPPG